MTNQPWMQYFDLDDSLVEAALVHPCTLMLSGYIEVGENGICADHHRVGKHSHRHNRMASISMHPYAFPPAALQLLRSR